MRVVSFEKIISDIKVALNRSTDLEEMDKENIAKAIRMFEELESDYHGTEEEQEDD